MRLENLKLCFLSSFLFSITCTAADNLDNGIRYLLGKQDANTGLWSINSSRVIIDSSESVFALRFVNDSLNPISLSTTEFFLDAILSNVPNITSFEALKLVISRERDSANLLELRNEDGGWGASLSKQSNPLDTFFAASALAMFDIEPENGWNSTISYFINARGGNGFWSLSGENDPSDLEITARILRLLKKLNSQVTGQNNQLLETLADGADRLRTLLRTDGRFSFNSDLSLPVSVIDTSQAYMTLIQFDPPAIYSDTLTFLVGNQQNDGSWEEFEKPDQNVYTTAIVLQVLQAIKLPTSSPRADLAVFSNSISFSPAQPVVGDSIIISAVIFNIGQNLAQNISVNFFSSDPRRAGSLIGSPQIVSSLFPNGSALVRVTLNSTTLTQNPEIFVYLDPDNNIPESNLTNNIASKRLVLPGLADAPEITGIDLYIDPAQISFNNEHTDTVFLIGSPTIIINLAIANLGDTNSGSFEIGVKDGVSTIASLTIPDLYAKRVTEFALPWNPTSGLHTIQASLDTENNIDESDELNNEAVVTVQVIGSTAAIVVNKVVNGVESSPPFSAYDEGLFTVATSYEDVIISVNVKNNDSGKLSDNTVLPLSTVGKYQWNVTNQIPGSYTATAEFFSSDENVLVDTVTNVFDVLPTVKLRNLRAFTNNIVEGGNILPQFLTVLLENGANVDADWNLTWELYHPEGYFIFGSMTPESITLLGSQGSKTLVLAEPVTGLLDDSGRYSIIVIAENNAERVVAETFFNILPILKLNVINEVIPAELTALDRAKATTIIKMTAVGEASNLDIPVAVREILVTPDQSIPDIASSSSTVNINGIVNALGENVPDGTQVSVYIPYGTLLGGVEPPPSHVDPQGSAPNPQIRLYDVESGNVTVDYSPAGNAFSKNEHSVSVMQIHQFLEEEDQWFGLNIGNAEIFLKGQ